MVTKNIDYTSRKQYIEITLGRPTSQIVLERGMILDKDRPGRFIMYFDPCRHDREALTVVSPAVRPAILLNSSPTHKKSSGRGTVLLYNVANWQFSVRGRDSQTDDNFHWYRGRQWWKVWQKWYVLHLWELWKQSSRIVYANRKLVCTTKKPNQEPMMKELPKQGQFLAEQLADWQFNGGSSRSCLIWEYSTTTTY